jgi:hypothetical protein
MAGKVFVKNSGTGTTGGLRFNPREAPEFVEEDRNLGRDDAAGKEKEDRKKRDTREKRHEKIKHMKHVSIPIKDKTRPAGDKKRNDEELSEMTGPASSTGYPLDVASGAKTGTGSAMGGAPVNIMTGYDMDVDPERISKDLGKKTHKKRIGRHGRTETVTGHRTRERAKDTARHRKGMGGSTEERYYSSKGLPRSNTRRPDLQSTRMNTLTRRTSNSKGKKGYRQLGDRRRSMKGRQSWQDDMRVRNSGIERSRAARREGTGRYTKAHIGLMPTKATMAHSAVGTLPSSTYQVAKQMTPNPSKAPYQSGVARTTGGMDMGTHTPTAPSGVVSGPGQSMFATSQDMLADAEELLRKASVSAGDLLELRQLIRELRRAIRASKLAKGVGEDAEHDDERPTPNAHRATTSNPTGATETDPDDDPRYWGAHPIGLLLPRRGHM